MKAYNILNGKPVKRQRNPADPEKFLLPRNSTEVEPPEFNANTHNCSFDGVQWNVTLIPEPEEEPKPPPIPAEYQLRSIRNKLLEDVDYITLRAYSQGQAVPQEWADYMQALRDLPANCTPALDENGGLTEVTWPVKPE